MNAKTALFFGALTLGILIDQATKFWVFTQIEFARGEIVVIPHWLSIVHAQNPGAVFGSLGGAEYRVPLFLAFAALATVMLARQWWVLPKESRYLPLTYGLILSGALGNAIDRVHKGTVTDFLLVQGDVLGVREFLVDWFGTYRWPAFNVADMALVGGVGLYLIWDLFIDRKTGKK